MWKIFYNKKAQSALEYTMTIIIVATAIMAMGTYIRRSINSRLKLIQEELNESRR